MESEKEYVRRLLYKLDKKNTAAAAVEIHRQLRGFGDNVMSEGMARKWIRQFKDECTNWCTHPCGPVGDLLLSMMGRGGFCPPDIIKLHIGDLDTELRKTQASRRSCRGSIYPHQQQTKSSSFLTQQPKPSDSLETTPLTAITHALHTFVTTNVSFIRLSSDSLVGEYGSIVNGDRYRAMITNFFIPELNNHDIQELWLQQDGATCHTARATIDLLKDTFGDRLISRFGPVNWPPRSCDLTPLDYFLWGYVKSLVYADKPQTLDHLEDNIRRVIADIRPQNWTPDWTTSEPAVAVLCQKSYLKCNATRLSFE
ncbi:heat shock 70kDa protein 8 [Trichonephila clavipes]|nr:heat shock 70kDa protein 8 [Trichonephila clavipes]